MRIFPGASIAGCTFFLLALLVVTKLVDAFTVLDITQGRVLARTKQNQVVGRAGIFKVGESSTRQKTTFHIATQLAANEKQQEDLVPYEIRIVSGARVVPKGDIFLRFVDTYGTATEEFLFDEDLVSNGNSASFTLPPDKIDPRQFGKLGGVIVRKSQQQPPDDGSKSPKTTTKSPKSGKSTKSTNPNNAIEPPVVCWNLSKVIINGKSFVFNADLGASESTVVSTDIEMDPNSSNISSESGFVSFESDTSNAPVITYSLPDTTPYSGRYIVTVPNVVSNKTWWKDSDSEEGADESQNLSFWAWRPIGGYTADVKYSDGSTSSPSSEQIYEVKGPAAKGVETNGSSIQKLNSIQLVSGESITNAEISVTLVDKDGRRSKKVPFDPALVRSGTTSPQTIFLDGNEDFSDLKRVVVSKARDEAGPTFLKALFYDDSNNIVLELNPKNESVELSADSVDNRLDNNVIAAALIPKGVKVRLAGDEDGGDEVQFIDGDVDVEYNELRALNNELQNRVSNIEISYSDGAFTDVVDWDLKSVIVNGETFSIQDGQKQLPYDSTRVEVETNLRVPGASELLQDTDLIKAFSERSSDMLHFYSETIESFDFELNLGNFNITELSVEKNEILPTFGLMVRDTLDEKSKYFGLLFVGGLEGQYSIQTIVRSSESDEVLMITGSERVDPQGASLSKLKIIRENFTFRGFYNGRLIGEADLKITKSRISSDTNDDTLQVPKEIVEAGCAYFAPGSYLARDGLTVTPESTTVTFKERPTIQTLNKRSSSFISTTERSFSIIEYVDLSTFYGRYGAGRTLNTFTLLPGEETEITVNTYKDSAAQSTEASTIFDSFTEEAANALENTIEEEQSNAEQYDQSRGAHAEVRGSYSGFGASVSSSLGESESESLARLEMARTVMSAVSKHAARASSKRDVEVNTTTERQVKDGSETKVVRQLKNINSSRTLNFVFRQINQEYISILHLVDLRVAFIGGGEGTYAEEDISNLQSFVSTYVKEEFVQDVVNRLYSKVQFITDYKDETRELLTKKEFERPPSIFSTEEDTVPSASYYKFDNDIKSVLDLSQDDGSFNVEVPGVILAYGTNVLRTDGVIAEAILGQGEALDQFGNELLKEDINAVKASSRLKNAQADLLNLQKDILTGGVQGDGTITKNQQLEGLRNLNLLEPKLIRKSSIDVVESD